MNKLNGYLASMLSVSLIGCAAMQVAELDPETGRFPTTITATVVKSEKVDLDAMKGLLLLPDNDFFQGQVSNIHYFDETITFDDLEKLIIQNNLSDQVPSV